MARVMDIFDTLNTAAPGEYAAAYDNVGFLVGHGGDEVRGVLVALDITRRAIDEAAECGKNVIVSHHPVIFEARKSVTDADAVGALLLELIERRISAICMHTNMDCARGGVNDALAEALGIRELSPVEPMGDGSIGGGRFGRIEKSMDLSEFMAQAASRLSANGLRYYDAGKRVEAVAVGGGSCGGYLPAVKRLGCDTFVTADVKHSTFLEAEELGINLIDAGHFATEDVVCPKMRDMIRRAHPELDVGVALSDVDNVKFFTL